MAAELLVGTQCTFSSSQEKPQASAEGQVPFKKKKIKAEWKRSFVHNMQVSRTCETREKTKIIEKIFQKL